MVDVSRVLDVMRSRSRVLGFCDTKVSLFHILSFCYRYSSGLESFSSLVLRRMSFWCDETVKGALIHILHLLPM